MNCRLCERDVVGLWIAVGAYVFVAFTPAEFEDFGVVPYKGDSYPTSMEFRTMVCPQQTFGGVAWLRAEVAGFDPRHISANPW